MRLNQKLIESNTVCVSKMPTKTITYTAYKLDGGHIQPFTRTRTVTLSSDAPRDRFKRKKAWVDLRDVDSFGESYWRPFLKNGGVDPVGGGDYTTMFSIDRTTGTKQQGTWVFADPDFATRNSSRKIEIYKTAGDSSIVHLVNVEAGDSIATAIQDDIDDTYTLTLCAQPNVADLQQAKYQVLKVKILDDGNSADSAMKIKGIYASDEFKLKAHDNGHGGQSRGRIHSKGNDWTTIKNKLDSNNLTDYVDVGDGGLLSSVTATTADYSSSGRDYSHSFTVSAFHKFNNDYTDIRPSALTRKIVIDDGAVTIGLKEGLASPLLYSIDDVNDTATIKQLLDDPTLENGEVKAMWAWFNVDNGGFETEVVSGSLAAGSHYKLKITLKDRAKNQNVVEIPSVRLVKLISAGTSLQPPAAKQMKRVGWTGGDNPKDTSGYIVEPSAATVDAAFDDTAALAITTSDGTVSSRFDVTYTYFDRNNDGDIVAVANQTMQVTLDDVNPTNYTFSANHYFETWGSITPNRATLAGRVSRGSHPAVDGDILPTTVTAVEGETTSNGTSTFPGSTKYAITAEVADWAGNTQADAITTEVELYTSMGAADWDVVVPNPVQSSNFSIDSLGHLVSLTPGATAGTLWLEWVEWDGSASHWSPTAAPANPPTHGTYTARFTSRDANGDSTSWVVAVEIDDVAPDATNNAFDSTRYYETSLPTDSTLAGRISGNIAAGESAQITSTGTTVSIANQSGVPSFPRVTEQTITAKIVDLAGNMSDPMTTKVEVYTAMDDGDWQVVPPAAPMKIGTFQSTSMDSFVQSVGGAVAGTLWVSPALSTITETNRAHTITFTARSSNGISLNSKSINVMLDDIAPVASNYAFTQTWYTTSVLSEDDLKGLVLYNGGNLPDGDTVIITDTGTPVQQAQLAGAGATVQTVTAKVQDAAGNISSGTITTVVEVYTAMEPGDWQVVPHDPMTIGTFQATDINNFVNPVVWYAYLGTLWVSPDLNTITETNRAHTITFTSRRSSDGNPESKDITIVLDDIAPDLGTAPDVNAFDSTRYYETSLPSNSVLAGRISGNIASGDSVQITSTGTAVDIAYPPQFPYPHFPRVTEQTITAKIVDLAGNMSDPMTTKVEIYNPMEPTDWAVIHPTAPMKIETFQNIIQTTHMNSFVELAPGAYWGTLWVSQNPDPTTITISNNTYTITFTSRSSDGTPESKSIDIVLDDIAPVASNYAFTLDKYFDTSMLSEDDLKGLVRFNGGNLPDGDTVNITGMGTPAQQTHPAGAGVTVQTVTAKVQDAAGNVSNGEITTVVEVYTAIEPANWDVVPSTYSAATKTNFDISNLTSLVTSTTGQSLGTLWVTWPSGAPDITGDSSALDGTYTATFTSRDTNGDTTSKNVEITFDTIPPDGYTFANFNTASLNNEIGSPSLSTYRVPDTYSINESPPTHSFNLGKAADSKDTLEGDDYVWISGVKDNPDSDLQIVELYLAKERNLNGWALKAGGSDVHIFGNENLAAGNHYILLRRQ